MTIAQIVNEYITARNKLVNYNYKKIYFKLHCCIDTGKLQYQTDYKFNRMIPTDKSIILKYNNKFIEELTKDNCVWISSINIADKYMEVNLVNYNFATLEENK